MKRGLGLGNCIRIPALVALLCALSMSIISMGALAQGGSRRGTVVMKGQSSHGGAPEGNGTVTPNGGYYVAPTVSCSLTIRNLNLVHITDGTCLLVTLEYLDSKLAPVVVGKITLSGGGGSFSTGSHPVSVSTSSKINTMTLRAQDGTVIMSGNVKGL